jgi:hypothetical protein
MRKTILILATAVLAFTPALAFAQHDTTPPVRTHTEPVHDRTPPAHDRTPSAIR